MSETLALLPETEYERLRERLKRTIQPYPTSAWFFFGDSALYLDEVPGALRFRSPSAEKYVAHVDVGIQRESNQVRLDLNSPVSESLCRASILAVGVTMFLTTLLASILASRSAGLLIFHAFILIVFLIAVKTVKTIRKEMAVRVRETITSSLRDLQAAQSQD